MSNKITLSSILIATFFIYGYSQKIKITTNKDPFEALVDIVISNKESDTVSQELPLSIVDIVSEYYAESTVPDSIASTVLSYLEGIYRDHGYHDTGNWSHSKDFSKYTYQSYNGILSKIEKSEFALPVNGSLTSKYGYRPKFRRFHRGVDIALNIGDTVKSALPGRVNTVGYEKNGYGQYIIIAHEDGMETLYGHLSQIIVSPGQKIDGGSPIGIGGSTGNSTGPHLHFETRYRGIAIDPDTWLNMTGN